MFRILKILAGFCGALLLIFTVQVAIVYLLPFPLNLVNVTLLSFLWFVIYRDYPGALWLALVLTITTDLFSSLPFGLITAAMISAIITARWVFGFFSNFSWYNIFFLGVLGIFFYKIFTYAFLLMIYFFVKKIDLIQLPNLVSLLTEIIINALAFLAAYVISLIFTKRKIIYHSL